MKLIIGVFLTLILVNIMPFWLLMLVILGSLSYFWWPKRYQKAVDNQLNKLFN